MSTLSKIWRFKDMRNRIITVVCLLALTRLLAHIPLPGVDLSKLQSFFDSNQVFGLLNMFSGGTMSKFSIILMGVGPYITSSIVFQLLGMVLPYFEQLQKEGEQGQKKINQYTRIATIPMAMIQAYGMFAILQSQNIIPTWGFGEMLLMLIIATAGTILLMWIGEIITEKGVGNGLSLIISLGILAGIPSEIRNTAVLIGSGDTSKIIGVIAYSIILIAVIAAIIYITEGQRNIPVSYARRTSGAKTYGVVDSHLPIRVNLAGVIPIIFAMSIMVVPGVLAKYLENARSINIKHVAQFISNLFQNDVFYAAFYFVLVIAFTFFYAYIVFKPDQIAENLQKQGGFIPGLRPGGETRTHLATVVSRITLVGALFLALIAVLPYIVQAITNINTLSLGGTGILIMVSVVIETMRQINAQLVMHTYDHY